MLGLCEFDNISIGASLGCSYVALFGGLSVCVFRNHDVVKYDLSKHENCEV